KYSEAEAAFWKQLEIDPLNAYAHENLGGMFLEVHNYAAAAPELEKTIALWPQKAAPRVHLGQALLNLNQHERAVAAFTRAVELEPSPTTWNNIAYQLAVKHTDLELAQ